MSKIMRFAGAAVFAAGLLLSAGVASAQTFDTLCYSYTRDLTIGSTGADVVALQTVLVARGHLIVPAGVAMGYFGPLTQAAVAAFQVSQGISPASGYFGLSSRVALSQLNSCTQPPVLVCAPGDNFNLQTGEACGTVTNTGGTCQPGHLFDSQTGLRCDVTPPEGTPLITIISPNGGETFTGDTIPVSWTTSNVPSTATLSARLMGATSDAVYQIGSGYLNDGQETLPVPPTVPNGSYALALQVISGVVSGTGGNGVVVDLSNGNINIARTGTPANALAITTSSLPSGTVGTPYSANVTSLWGSGTPVWSVSAGALPPGISLQSIPLGGAKGLAGTPTTAGTYTFTVRLTVGAETATKQLSIVVAPAVASAQFVDLSVKDISMGEVAGMHYKVCNNGNVEQVSFVTRAVANGISSGVSIPRADLAPGTCKTFSHSEARYSYFNMVAGNSYAVTVTADPNNHIVESNEQNNSASATVTVPAATPAPFVDLSVKDISMGETSMLFKVCNNGNVTQVAYATNIAANGVSTGINTPAANLAPGVCAIHSIGGFGYSRWNMQAGNAYTVTVTADPNNHIVESNEQNNATSATITVPGAVLGESSTPQSVAVFCQAFNSNLSKGSSGPEVRALQSTLTKDGEVVEATGYFGVLTHAAVVAFQEKYASEVLTPVGLTSGTGYVGLTTRAKLNQLNSCSR